MRIQSLSRDEAVAAVVGALGFDPDSVDLTVPEVVAASVRRAASFTCPCTPRRLASVTRMAASGLVDAPADDESFPVRSMIEMLTAYGDLIEAPLRTESGSDQRMLFLAAPSFVQVGSVTLLTGIRAEGIPLLSGGEAELIECEGHVRRLAPGLGPTPEDLQQLGLRSISPEHWLGTPMLIEPDELVADYDRRLDAAGPAGSIEDCLILDAAAPVNYYRGRWRAVSSKDSGRFVARRPTAYGAPLWSYIHLEDGRVERVLDLPVHERLHRACDEAWRLQAAIDVLSGSPQILRVGRGRRSDTSTIHLLSPPPSWAQRRLDTVARPIPRERSLVSYTIATDHLQAELAFLQQYLWTIRLQDGANE
jgi:hypothetical protein